jgi:hypothetical protein
VAAFDDDPAKIEGRIDGCRCFPVDIMESTVRDLGIQIAIVTTPPSAAQKATDALVRAGVRSIVSFAATPLQVPEGVSIIDMDITAALETAAYIARETPAAVAAEADAEVDKVAAPLLRQLDTLLAGNEVKLDELARRIGAQIVSSETCPQRVVDKIYAGDRVSDLLNEASDRTLLVTNLMSLQMIRVAELMDVPAICFVNGVCPEPEIVTKADSTGTTLMVSPIGVFETCGLIYQSLAAAPAGSPTARA